MFDRIDDLSSTCGSDRRERTGRQLTPADAALLVAAGVLAGVTSTVAGLASLVSYPALLAAGLSAVEANVTNTSALLFVALGAATGSRAELHGQGRRVAVLGGVALGGGTVGAVLLLTTPDGTFERVVPWLIAGAAALLLVRQRLTGSAVTGSAAAGVRGAGLKGASSTASEAASEPPSEAEPPSEPEPLSEPEPISEAEFPFESEPEPASGGRGPTTVRPETAGSALAVAGLRPWAVAGMFGVAVYVGYFGAGGGVALLALLAVALPEPLARVNALKNVSSGFANVAATVVFAASGPVSWWDVLPLGCGLFVGGTTGPAIVRRLPEPVLRWTVALAAFGLAIALAVNAYR